MNGKTSPGSHLARVQSNRFRVTLVFSTALPGLGTAPRSPAREEEQEQKYSSGGSQRPARPASPTATRSTAWLKQDLKYSNYIM